MAVAVSVFDIDSGAGLAAVIRLMAEVPVNATEGEGQFVPAADS
jgi:hypothetical protein